MKNWQGHLIGVISDTHGLLRPEAIAALEGCDLILHAGDIGDSGVLERLRLIAPVVAVRGNNDRGAWAHKLSEFEVIKSAGVSIYMLHNENELDLHPVAAGFQVVVAGHSHVPKITDRNGVLFLNPGSAGPRRFKLPVTLAHLTIERGRPQAKIIEL